MITSRGGVYKCVIFIWGFTKDVVFWINVYFNISHCTTDSTAKWLETEPRRNHNCWESMVVSIYAHEPQEKKKKKRRKTEKKKVVWEQNSLGFDLFFFLHYKYVFKIYSGVIFKLSIPPLPSPSIHNGFFFFLIPHLTFCLCMILHFSLGNANSQYSTAAKLLLSWGWYRNRYRAIVCLNGD